MTHGLTRVSLAPLLDRRMDEARYEAAQLFEACRKDNNVAVHDPRVTRKSTDDYLDQMERYFMQDDEALLEDARPPNFQGGVWPKYAERPPDLREAISLADLDPAHYPLVPHWGSRGDPKWRFMWDGGKNIDTAEDLRATKVFPKAFPEWEQTMNAIQAEMRATLESIARMLEIGAEEHGIRMKMGDFVDPVVTGPAYLSPNGIQLDEFLMESGLDIREMVRKSGITVNNFIDLTTESVDRMIAETAGNPLDKWPTACRIINGAHFDLNWGTLHRRGRIRGAKLWRRDGTAFISSVPDGHQLFQVGKQLEWQTGGYLMAGLHEVAVFQQTIVDAMHRIVLGQPPVRVSATCFGTMGHSCDQAILPGFWERLDDDDRPHVRMRYPTVKSGDFVRYCIGAIK